MQARQRSVASRLFYLSRLLIITLFCPRKFNAVLRSISKGELFSKGLLKTKSAAIEQILLDYLAVAKRHRGKGIGSEILRTMREKYKGKGESLHNGYENHS